MCWMTVNKKSRKRRLIGLPTVINVTRNEHANNGVVASPPLNQKLKQAQIIRRASRRSSSLIVGFLGFPRVSLGESMQFKRACSSVFRGNRDKRCRLLWARNNTTRTPSARCIKPFWFLFWFMPALRVKQWCKSWVKSRCSPPIKSRCWQSVVAYFRRDVRIFASPWYNAADNVYVCKTFQTKSHGHAHVFPLFPLRLRHTDLGQDTLTTTSHLLNRQAVLS